MSNKTIAILLLAAILISGTATMISISKLHTLRSTITGFATSNVTGFANVSITGVTSIALLDASVNFGSCAPASSGWTNVSSNTTSTAICNYPQGAPDFIRIENDGNVYINVTINSSLTAAQLIGGTNPAFYYDTENSGGSNPGCGTDPGAGNGGVCNHAGNCTTRNWTNFAAANTAYKACENLTYGDTSNEFDTYMLIQIPFDAPVRGALSSNITFRATALP